MQISRTRGTAFVMQITRLRYLYNTHNTQPNSTSRTAVPAACRSVSQAGSDLCALHSTVVLESTVPSTDAHLRLNPSSESAQAFLQFERYAYRSERPVVDKQTTECKRRSSAQRL